MSEATIRKPAMDDRQIPAAHLASVITQCHTMSHCSQQTILTRDCTGKNEGNVIALNIRQRVC